MRRGTPIACVLACLAAGCGPPRLTPNDPGGQLVFAESGGASVLTATGVQQFDEARLPEPVVRRSTNDPYRPATGFLIPADGIWRRTSVPVAASGHGLAVVLRSSDALVPAWGGEILLRIDAIVPKSAFPEAAARAPRSVAIVLDGAGAEADALVETIASRLGERDRVALVDSASGARTILPIVPGSSRSLLSAAAQRVLAQPRGGPDLASALAHARRRLRTLPAGHEGQVVVLTDGASMRTAAQGRLVSEEVERLRAAGVRVTAIATTPELVASLLTPLGEDVHADEDALAAAMEAVPPPGNVALRDVVLEISSVPAPARVLELSGGAATLGIERDRLFFGDLYVGEARTEVARVLLPVWVPEEPLELVVVARYRDAATNEPLTAEATLDATYSASAARIAQARHGDVIAYASALAMVRRLQRAFVGSEVDRLGGLRPLVAWQASSMARLAATSGDGALATQAEVLRTLLEAVRD